MCTLAWIQGPEGYELFFNRDESRRRSVATGPRPARQGAVDYLAPTDGDAGGTWLGVNEHGVSVALLNGYLAARRPLESYSSRGGLVRSLLDVASAGEATGRLGALDLTPFQGFRIAFFGVGESRSFVWDGERLAEVELTAPVVSSSFDAVSALRERTKVLRELEPPAAGASAERMRSFLRSHLPERGPDSVCMHRADARTVSASHIVVTEREVSFHYCPGPPCRTDFDAPVSLARSKPGDS